MTYKLPSCKVPRVRGLTLSKAREAISKANCAVGKLTKEHSRRIRKGRVIASSPSSGRTKPHGTKVALVLSRGK